MPGHTDSAIYIQAPPDVVWQKVNDIESWPTLFDGEYASAQVLHRDTDRIRFQLVTALREGQTYRWTSERFLDQSGRTVVARRIDTGPFEYMHIFQSVTPTGSGSLLRWVQDFEARSDAPFTDAQVQDRIGKSSAVNLAQHKRIIERSIAQPSLTPASENGPSIGTPKRTGHVDIRVLAQASLEHVWDVANDRTAWAHAGHPVEDKFNDGEESTFAVNTPPDAQGRRWSFTVHRIRDNSNKTVFSRRYGSPDFLYSNQWFGYRETDSGTELRCVSDFELTAKATITAGEMEQIMNLSMARNMEQVARIVDATFAQSIEVTR